MGFESFRVELRGGKAETEEVVRALPGVRPDCDSMPLKGSSFHVVEDGRHAFEVEVMSSPSRISCRFTLCHPPSADEAFLRLVGNLMKRLGMGVTIREDVRPEHARSFSPGEFAEFSPVASQYIGAKRAEWVAAFGDEALAATTAEVYQRIILPRCQPGVAQPT